MTARFRFFLNEYSRSLELSCLDVRSPRPDMYSLVLTLGDMPVLWPSEPAAAAVVVVAVVKKSLVD